MTTSTPIDKEEEIEQLLWDLAETAVMYGDYGGEGGRTNSKLKSVKKLIMSQIISARIEELTNLIDPGAWGNSTIKTDPESVYNGETIEVVDVNDAKTRIDELSKYLSGKETK